MSIHIFLDSYIIELQKCAFDVDNTQRMNVKKINVVDIEDTTKLNANREMFRHTLPGSNIVSLQDGNLMPSKIQADIEIEVTSDIRQGLCCTCTLMTTCQCMAIAVQ